MNATTIQNVQTTKHVLNIAVETHVSYPIFVDKVLFVKLLLTDLFVDVLKNGVVYQQLNVSNTQCSIQTQASAVAALNSSLNSYASQATRVQAAAQAAAAAYDAAALNQLQQQFLRNNTAAVAQLAAAQQQQQQRALQQQQQQVIRDDLFVISY